MYANMRRVQNVLLVHMPMWSLSFSSSSIANAPTAAATAATVFFLAHSE